MMLSNIHLTEIEKDELRKKYLDMSDKELFIKPEYQDWKRIKTQYESGRYYIKTRTGAEKLNMYKNWRLPSKRKSFINFLVDMGEKPKPNASINRHNQNYHYYPTNCYWDEVYCTKKSTSDKIDKTALEKIIARFSQKIRSYIEANSITRVRDIPGYFQWNTLNKANRDRFPIRWRQGGSLIPFVNFINDIGLPADEFTELIITKNGVYDRIANLNKAEFTTTNTRWAKPYKELGEYVRNSRGFIVIHKTNTLF